MSNYKSHNVLRIRLLSPFIAIHTMPGTVDCAVLTDPIELHTTADFSNDIDTSSKIIHGTNVCSKCMDIIKTIIALLLLYSFYAVIYFAFTYFSIHMGHHSYLGYFIFFFAFKILLVSIAITQLCKKEQEPKQRASSFEVEHENL